MINKLNFGAEDKYSLTKKGEEEAKSIFNKYKIDKEQNLQWNEIIKMDNTDFIQTKIITKKK